PYLPGLRHAGIDEPDTEPGAVAKPAGGDHVDVGAVPVQVVDFLAQPTRRGTAVHFGLDHDTSGDDVESAREAQQRGHFSTSTAGLGHRQPAQLVLDRCGHRHRSVLLSNAAFRLAASACGSCRPGACGEATLSSTVRAPNPSAAERRRSGVGTESTSASTASTRSRGACCESTSKCCSGEKPAVSPG